MCSMRCLWTKLRKCTCNTKKPRIDVRNHTTSHVSSESKGRSSHRKNWICLYFLKAYLLPFDMQMLMEVLLSMHYAELKELGPVLRPDPCWWGSVISEFECCIKLRQIANPQHEHSDLRIPMSFDSFCTSVAVFVSTSKLCLVFESLLINLSVPCTRTDWVIICHGFFFLEWNSEGGEQRCFNKRR